MVIPSHLDTATLVYVVEILQEERRIAEQEELRLEDPEDNAILLITGRQQGLEAAIERIDLLARLGRLP